MKQTIVILALLCAGLLSSAGGAELSGTVVAPDGEALVGVSVVTDVSGVAGQTDERGRYVMEVPETVTRVTFSAIGYKPRQFRADDVPSVVMLETMYYEIDGILVTADRVQSGVDAIAFDNVTRAEIERDYTVAEFPLLLASTPNLLAYTDGGAPLGYSYLKIRGFDDKRVTTYINGVPLNDPEDQATYFVDLPDFGANVSDIQVQRGVGNSLYGDASFGGSINIVSSVFDKTRGARLRTGYGEFTSGGKFFGRQISKQSVEYATGLVDGRWAFYGRFSRQSSSGYREQSWYNGWSYYLSAGRLDHGMTTELHVYGGPIRTHLAYYGVDRDVLRDNRLANPGIAGYELLEYSNATDNFNQPHYQLHNVIQLSEQVVLANTLYYIRGKGYYEQFKPGQDYIEYSIDPSQTGGQTSGDLVRQKWVYKNQYGWNPRLDFQHDHGSHALGGSFYLYDSDHWGEVVWAEHIDGAVSPRHRYYLYGGRKAVASLYGQEYYRLTDELAAQVTAQVRYERYSLDQTRMGPFPGYDFDVDWLFFSPRAGLVYTVDERLSLFANAAVSSRAPTDDDIYDADKPGAFPSLEMIDSVGTYPGGVIYAASGDVTAKPERLYDFELGGRYRTDRYALGVNLFFMDFKNEILEYAGSREGRDVTINVDGSYHSGVELTGVVKLLDELIVNGNFAFNYNRVKDYLLQYRVDSVTILGDTVKLSESVNCKDKKLPNFPEYLANVLADYEKGRLRLTYHGKLIGRQYADLWNIEDFSIDPVFVSSLAASVSVGEFLQLGTLKLNVRVDNLFDEKYEAVASYAENWAWRQPGSPVQVDGWAAYFVAPERSFYGQVSLELF
ncbi:MAG TPA: TonB-dependent receptor [Acidobacteriota bacterium]|nr:TonB-dependent receptor [Acidobacteriota bacterium]